jgi:ribose transport system permease protein
MNALSVRNWAARIIAKETLFRYGLILAFIPMIALFGIARPVFLTPMNFLMLLRQVVVLSIMSLGMTIVVIGGGIDLSVGEALDFGAISSVAIMNSGAGFLVGLVGGLAFGGLVGVFNGMMIAGLGIFPFLATLMTIFISKSIQFMYSKGFQSVVLTKDIPSFSFLGNGYISFMPFPVLFLVFVVFVFFVIAYKTRFGRYIVACGSNIRAAWLAGIPAKQYVLLTYVLCSVTCALAGIVETSRIGLATPLQGGSYLYDVLGAVFMGTSISQTRRANIFGSVIGAIFFGIITNGMTLMAISPYMQLFVKGVSILLILAFAAAGKKMIGEKA